jgi:transposase-like protein
MPSALQQVDWDLAQALYIQGVAYKAIAEQVGVTEATLRQRAHRHGWRALKTASVTAAAQAVTGHASKTLVQRARDVRDAIAAELERQMDLLSQCRPTDVQQLFDRGQGRISATKNLVGACSQLYGWQQQVDRPLLAVGTVSTLHLFQLQAAQAHQPVIDLESPPPTEQDPTSR